MTTSELTTPPRAPAVPVDPTFRDAFAEADTLIGVVPVAGPPAVLLAGPWVLFALLVAGPFTCLLTFVVVLVAAAGVVGLGVAILASPYLLARRFQAHGSTQHASDADAARVAPVEWRRAVA